MILKNFEKQRKAYYSFLTNRKIKDEEYEHVLNVGNKFEMKTMKYYHDLYLKWDVCFWLKHLKNIEVIG